VVFEVDPKAALHSQEEEQRNREEEEQLLRRRRKIYSWSAVATALSFALVFAIVSVVQIMRFNDFHTTTDDLYLDLSKAEPDMRVTFDVYNPAQLHAVSVQDMSCDVLVFNGDRQDLQLLGKLVSDEKLQSKPGRHTIQHSTSLINTNATLLADLIAGRSLKEHAEFDCDVALVVKLWGFVPVPKSMHVVTKFGHDDDSDSDSDSDSDVAADDTTKAASGVSARVIDYGIFFPNIYTVALQCQTEVTLHRDHALNLLITALVEHTNTFTLVMPEAGYTVNANFLGSFHPANRTSDRSQRPREPHEGARRGSTEVKHIKLYAHGAVVTKSDVVLKGDGSWVVNIPAKVEMSCEYPDCLMNLPALLNSYTDAKGSYLRYQESILGVVGQSARKLLDADYFNFDEEVMGIEFTLYISFEENDGYFGTQVIGSLDDVKVEFEAKVEETSSTTTDSDINDSDINGPFTALLSQNQDLVNSAPNAWLPDGNRFNVESLAELLIDEAHMSLEYDYETIMEEGPITMQFTAGDAPVEGLDSFLFATVSESVLTFLGVDVDKNKKEPAMGFAIGFSEEAMHAWMLTSKYDSVLAGDGNGDNAYFQMDWAQEGSSDTMALTLRGHKASGDARVVLTTDEASAERLQGSATATMIGRSSWPAAGESSLAVNASGSFTVPQDKDSFTFEVGGTYTAAVGDAAGAAAKSMSGRIFGEYTDVSFKADVSLDLPDEPRTYEFNSMAEINGGDIDATIRANIKEGDVTTSGLELTVDINSNRSPRPGEDGNEFDNLDWNIRGEVVKNGAVVDSVGSDLTFSSNIATVLEKQGSLDLESLELTTSFSAFVNSDTLQIGVNLMDDNSPSTEANFQALIKANDYDALVVDVQVTKIADAIGVDVGMGVLDDILLNVTVDVTEEVDLMSLRVLAPESYILPVDYLMTLSFDMTRWELDTAASFNMMHQVGSAGYDGTNYKMTLGVEVDAPEDLDELDDLTIGTYIWADEDFTALSSPSNAMFSWTMEGTTNPQVSSRRFRKEQDVTVRQAMTWDKSKAGMNMEMGLTHFDMEDMGQFESNSAYMDMRVFEEDDLCMMDIKVCGEMTNTDAMTFNVGAVAKVGDALSGSGTMRGAEIGGVMYMESNAEWTRTEDELMGMDITDINAADSMTMQMAMEGTDIGNAFWNVETKDESSESETSLADMNSIAGVSSDSFPSIGDSPGNCAAALSITECTAPPPVVNVAATFPDLSLDSLNTNPTFKAQFETDVIAAVASAAGVSTSQVTIVSIMAGSVVVDTRIEFLPEETEKLTLVAGTPVSTFAQAVSSALPAGNPYGTVEVTTYGPVVARTPPAVPVVDETTSAGAMDTKPLFVRLVTMAWLAILAPRLLNMRY